MAGLGEINIKVTPQDLMTKAGEVETARKRLEGHFNEIKSIISRTNLYWLGEAGELHRKLYTDQQENIDSMFGRMQEHTTDLRAIAANYGAVEQEIENLALELPGDIIS